MDFGLTILSPRVAVPASPRPALGGSRESAMRGAGASIMQPPTPRSLPPPSPIPATPRRVLAAAMAFEPPSPMSLNAPEVDPIAALMEHSREAAAAKSSFLANYGIGQDEYTSRMAALQREHRARGGVVAHAVAEVAPVPASGKKKRRGRRHVQPLDPTTTGVRQLDDYESAAASPISAHDATYDDWGAPRPVSAIPDHYHTDMTRSYPLHPREPQQQQPDQQWDAVESVRVALEQKEEEPITPRQQVKSTGRRPAGLQKSPRHSPGSSPKRKGGKKLSASVTASPTLAPAIADHSVLTVGEELAHDASLRDSKQASRAGSTRASPRLGSSLAPSALHIPSAIPLSLSTVVEIAPATSQALQKKGKKKVSSKTAKHTTTTDDSAAQEPPKGVARTRSMVSSRGSVVIDSATPLSVEALARHGSGGHSRQVSSISTKGPLSPRARVLVSDSDDDDIASAVSLFDSNASSISESPSIVALLTVAADSDQEEDHSSGTKVFELTTGAAALASVPPPAKVVVPPPQQTMGFEANAALLAAARKLAPLSATLATGSDNSAFIPLNSKPTPSSRRARAQAAAARRAEAERTRAAQVEKRQLELEAEAAASFEEAHKKLPLPASMTSRPRAPSVLMTALSTPQGDHDDMVRRLHQLHSSALSGDVYTGSRGGGGEALDGEPRRRRLGLDPGLGVSPSPNLSPTASDGVMRRRLSPRAIPAPSLAELEARAPAQRPLGLQVYPDSSNQTSAASSLAGSVVDLHAAWRPRTRSEANFNPLANLKELMARNQALGAELQARVTAELRPHQAGGLHVVVTPPITPNSAAANAAFRQRTTPRKPEPQHFTPPKPAPLPKAASNPQPTESAASVPKTKRGPVTTTDGAAKKPGKLARGPACIAITIETPAVVPPVAKAAPPEPASPIPAPVPPPFVLAPVIAAPPVAPTTVAATAAQPAAAPLPAPAASTLTPAPLPASLPPSPKLGPAGSKPRLGLRSSSVSGAAAPVPPSRRASTQVATGGASSPSRSPVMKPRPSISNTASPKFLPTDQAYAPDLVFSPLASPLEAALAAASAPEQLKSLRISRNLDRLGSGRSEEVGGLRTLHSPLSSSSSPLSSKEMSVVDRLMQPIHRRPSKVASTTFVPVKTDLSEWESEDTSMMLHAPQTIQSMQTFSFSSKRAEGGAQGVHPELTAGVWASSLSPRASIAIPSIAEHDYLARRPQELLQVIQMVAATDSPSEAEESPTEEFDGPVEVQQWRHDDDVERVDPRDRPLSTDVEHTDIEYEEPPLVKQPLEEDEEQTDVAPAEVAMETEAHEDASDLGDSHEPAEGPDADANVVEPESVLEHEDPTTLSRRLTPEPRFEDEVEFDANGNAADIDTDGDFLHSDADAIGFDDAQQDVASEIHDQQDFAPDDEPYPLAEDESASFSRPISSMGTTDALEFELQPELTDEPSLVEDAYQEDEAEQSAEFQPESYPPEESSYTFDTRLPSKVPSSTTFNSYPSDDSIEVRMPLRLKQVRNADYSGLLRVVQLNTSKQAEIRLKRSTPHERKVLFDPLEEQRLAEVTSRWIATHAEDAAAAEEKESPFKSPRRAARPTIAPAILSASPSAPKIAGVGAQRALRAQDLSQHRQTQLSREHVFAVRAASKKEPHFQAPPAPSLPSSGSRSPTKQLLPVRVASSSFAFYANANEPPLQVEFPRQPPPYMDVPSPKQMTSPRRPPVAAGSQSARASVAHPTAGPPLIAPSAWQAPAPRPAESQPPSLSVLAAALAHQSGLALELRSASALPLFPPQHAHKAAFISAVRRETEDHTSILAVTAPSRRAAARLHQQQNPPAQVLTIDHGNRAKRA